MVLVTLVKKLGMVGQHEVFIFSQLFILDKKFLPLTKDYSYMLQVPKLVNVCSEKNKKDA